MSRKLAETVEAFLNDVESLTRQRFYDPPDQEQGPIEVFLVRDGKQRGYPFGELGMAQQTQVFSDYLDLDKYEDAGISWRQINQVFWNVIEGKPRSEWLDGTGLSPPDRKKSLDDLRAAGNEKQPRQTKTHDRGHGR